MKTTNSASKLAKTIGEAADTIAKRILVRLSRDGLKGREEIITPQIASDLTGHLVDEIQSRLNGKTIKNVTFEVHCYKHSEENVTGADIVGILEIKHMSQTCKKAFLAQAKIAATASKAGKEIEFYARDHRLLRQCKDMLKITPDSFPLGLIPRSLLRLCRG